MRPGVHALIVASPAIARFVVQHFPQLEVHISTQHSTTNSSAIRFWKQMGMAPGSARPGVLFGADHGDDQAFRASGGGVHPWRDVHFLFRPLCALQPYDEPRCEPRRMRAELPLEI